MISMPFAHSVGVGIWKVYASFARQVKVKLLEVITTGNNYSSSV